MKLIRSLVYLGLGGSLAFTALPGLTAPPVSKGAPATAAQAFPKWRPQIVPTVGAAAPGTRPVDSEPSTAFSTPSGDFPLLSAVRVKTLTESIGTYCTNFSGFSGATVFNESITVGPHGTLRVDFSSASSIDTGGTLDGVFFDCIIQQGTTQWFCPGAEGAPFLSRRTDPEYHGNSQQSAFVSIFSTGTPFVGAAPSLTPGVPASVRIVMYTNTGVGQLCGANLLIGY